MTTMLSRNPACNEQLELEGKPHPRTCRVCGLGPCKDREPLPVAVKALRVKIKGGSHYQNGVIRKAFVEFLLSQGFGVTYPRDYEDADRAFVIRGEPDAFANLESRVGNFRIRFDEWDTGGTLDRILNLERKIHNDGDVSAALTELRTFVVNEAKKSRR